MNWTLADAVNNARFMMELLAACVVFLLPLKKRRRFLLRLIPGLVICTLPALLYIPSTGALLIVTKYLPLLVLAAALVFFCCDVSFYDAVYCVLCAYATQHFAYSLLVACAYNTDYYASTWYANWLSPVYFLCYGGTYVLFYFLFARGLPEGGRYGSDARQSMLSVVLVLPFALFFSLVAKMWFYEEGGRVFLVCQFYAMLCCFFVLWVQTSQRKRTRLQAELEVQRQLRAKQQEQYELSRENIALINRKCHDLKHQVAALRTVRGEEAREASLREIERSVMIYDAIVKTGNEVLDTVLTEKSLLCEREHITMTCVADGSKLDFMDAVDLYTIFGNALDNAIESVTAIPDPERRVIAVTVYTRSSLLLIQLENYYEQPLTFADGLPVTTKGQNGFHGFGMKSIQYTAEKYGGIMTVHAEDHLFILRVSIPMSGQ
ncbi:ATP-binding protein [Lawsonibacter faecis]|uniref:Sensor histidine kinase n=1 Tax=Lawsonibacter faecis TaxID=2763052 RepID=A0A8J6JNZ8_9FIRM|nr:ATP-binding protein [Lawsonibacter faecis]MBC5738509.1 sensor histidine kinase [Lawsonibacter faecis]